MVDSEDPSGFNTADAILTKLKEIGVSNIFMNSGTDYAPIIESYSKLKSRKIPLPEMIVVPHEGPAVAMAMGYYLAKGVPQAVMVHTVPGSFNSLNNTANARNMYVPLYLIAGRTPVTERGNFAGKDLAVHWFQELRDQGEVLRQICKWDWEHRFGDQVYDELVRGYEMAVSEPMGPVYITFPREKLSEKSVPSDTGKLPSPISFGGPDSKVIEKIVHELLNAKNPLVTTGFLGRNTAAVVELIRLCERLSIPVIQSFYYLSFPTNHELYAGKVGGKFANEMLSRSDLVIAIDVDIPWVPSQCSPKNSAKVILIDSDPLKEAIPTWNFRVDMRVKGNSVIILSEINRKLEKSSVSVSDNYDLIRARFSEVRSHHMKMKEYFRSYATGHSKDRPIDPSWLSYCLNNEVKDGTFIFAETVRSPFFEYLTTDNYSFTFSTSPFGGLGWSFGTALGAKLGKQESTVIALMGDGSYIYNNPVACHYVSRSRDLPILSVIYNNGSWMASRDPVEHMYPEGYAVRNKEFPGTVLKPSPDFELVARSCGARSLRIESPDDVESVIKESLKYLEEERNQVLLNVILKEPA